MINTTEELTMPRDTRTTTGPIGISYTTAQLNTLLNNFSQGKIIRKADIDLIISYYSDFTSHVHNLTDVVSKKTFGNTGSGSSSTDTTNNPSDLNAVPGLPAANSTITAAKHNEIATAVNTTAGHYHGWTDN